MQRFKTLLGDAQTLRPLLNKAQVLAALQQQFNRATPPYIAEASQVSGLIFGTMSISVANNTIAAKLRQLAPEVVQALQNGGCEVNELRVKVQVAYTAFKPKRQPRVLTRQACNTLEQLSTSLPDSPLKNAVQKMLAKKNSI